MTAVPRQDLSLAGQPTALVRPSSLPAAGGKSAARKPIQPELGAAARPGRRVSDIRDADQLVAGRAVVAGPPRHLAARRPSARLGRPTVLISPHGGKGLTGGQVAGGRHHRDPSVASPWPDRCLVWAWRSERLLGSVPPRRYDTGRGRLLRRCLLVECRFAALDRDAGQTRLPARRAHRVQSRRSDAGSLRQPASIGVASWPAPDNLPVSPPPATSITARHAGPVGRRECPARFSLSLLRPRFPTLAL